MTTSETQALFDAFVRLAHALRLNGVDVGGHGLPAVVDNFGNHQRYVRPKLVLDPSDFERVRLILESLKPTTRGDPERARPWMEIAGLRIVTRP